jgi:predicted nucleic acid-binding protein
VVTNLGWLDTKIFVHALFPNDRQFSRCNAILRGLEAGDVEGLVDSVVVHELTYVLKRTAKFRTRASIARYVRGFVLLDTVQMSNKPLLIGALSRWESSESLGFADAWLTEVALATKLSVCSANIKDFDGRVANSFGDVSNA